MTGLDKPIEYQFLSSSFQSRVEGEINHLRSQPTDFFSGVLADIPDQIQTETGGFGTRQLASFDKIVITDDLTKLGVAPSGVNFIAGGRAPGDGVLYIYIGDGGFVLPNGRPFSIGELIVHELGHYTQAAIEAEQANAMQVGGIYGPLIQGENSEAVAVARGNEVATSAGLSPLTIPSNGILAVPSPGAPVISVKPRCFHAGTSIMMADGRVKPIEDIRVKDIVLAFDAAGALRPAEVLRLLPGITNEWIELGDGTRVTPGHRYLRPNGTFAAIQKILAEDGIVVDASGHPMVVVGSRKSASDANSDAGWTYPDVFQWGNAVLKTNPICGWRTYNFEVEGLHTYIAGGCRVHNDGCMQEGDVFNNVTFDPNTGELARTGVDEFGNPIKVTELVSGSGELVLVERAVSFKSNDAVVRTSWTEFDEANNPVGEPARDVAFPNVVITGEQIGSIFGSSLGQLMGGDDVFARIAAGSALSAVLGNVGETLHIYFNDTRSLSDPNSPALTLSQSADAAFRDIRTDFANALQSQAIGAVSSFLTGELAEALGFDGTSFGDQLLRVASSSLINTALTNLTNIALGVPNTSFLTGISGNLASGVGSFLGSYLAHTIVQPENIGGAIGSSIGGALGTAIGGSAFVGSIGVEILTSLALAEAIGGASSLILGIVLPGIGAFIGVLLGTLLGNVIGDLFGPPAHYATGGATLSNGDQDFVATPVLANYGDLAGMVLKLQTAATEVLNAYLDAIGGDVVADGWVNVYFYSTSDGPSETTSVSAYHAAGDTTVAYDAVEVSPGGATALFKLNYTVIKALKQTHIAGGDLYIKRAIDKSTATTLQQLSGELKIAEDFGRYLANKDIIDALIAQNPDSAFAAGWIVTLLRAEELGITQLNKTDFYGGLVPFLKSFNLDRFGATLADVSVALEGNKLVISIAQGAGHAPRRIEIDNYAQMTGLDHLVASPTGAPVNGGDHDDLWIAANGVNSTFTDVSQHFDTLSNDVLIGGTGNDTINAGVGADLIYGGAGNDTIDAGTGDDVVTGGTGNDTIEGGAGDDVFIFNRGDGADTIHDIGVVVQRDELNPDFGRDLGDGIVQPLFRPISSTDIGTVISGGSDILQFGRGISVDDLIVRFVGANLVIAIKDPAHPDWGFDQLTDKIQLANWLDTKQRVETFQFADGSVLRAADIAFLAEVPASVVTLLDVTWDAAGLNSTTNARIVVGTAGNDTIAASDGVDIVYANGGNDTVSGGAGNDYLDGGTGNDTLTGGDGADVYLFDRGYGSDVIDANHSDAGVDRVLLGAGIVAADITFVQVGNDLQLLIAGSSDTLTMRDWFLGASHQVGSFVLANGSTVPVVVTAHAPVVTVASASVQAATRGQVLQASSLFSATDLDNDPLVYLLYDATVGGGHFEVNGVAQPEGNGQYFAVSAADFAHTTFVTGQSGADDLSVGAGDGQYFSGWSSIHVNAAVNHVPVVTVPNVAAQPGAGTVLQLSSLFTATDADNDSLAVILFDPTGGGHFETNGVARPEGQIVGLNPTEAANTTFVGAEGSSDDLLIGASDGIEFSGWTSLHVAFGTSGNNTINGTAGSDWLVGLAGNDTLDGGAGVDTLVGGAGDDTYYVDSSSDRVIENANEGNDTVVSSVSLTLAANLENLTLSGTSGINGTGNSLDNVITGNAGSNTLNGGAGNDTLNGGAGADTMVGGTGNDTYVVDNAGDVVTENAGEGTDTVRTSLASYTLAANVENLIDTTGMAQTLTGNALGNIITGGGGNDLIDGGAGTDTVVYGGLRSEYQISQNANGSIHIVDLRANSPDGTDDVSNVEFFQFADRTIGVANIINHAPVVTAGGTTAQAAVGQILQLSSLATVSDVDGDPLAVILYDGTVGGGHFEVSGVAKPEAQLFGVSQGDIANTVFVGAEGSTDDISIGVSDNIAFTGWVTWHVAFGTSGNNTLTGTTGNDWLLGLAGSDSIQGGAGNDVLDGGAGNDTMSGGAGDDVFVVDSASDQVIENANEGSDRVNSTVSYTLSANVEVLAFYGTANLTGTGNALDNVFWSNSGVDTFIGGAGNDVYIINNSADQITENAGEGIESVYTSATYALSANVESVILIGTASINGTGNSLNNYVTGNSADNILTGGGGNDIIDGGAGTDTAVYSGNRANYVVSYNAGTQTITLTDQRGGAPDGVDTITGVEFFQFADGTITVGSLLGGAPVVLDLDGNGVDIVQLAASTARFDMNGDGQRDATAWAGPADGLLAIDLGEDGQAGADGVIDQTKEIVFTEWAPGTTSDMAALRRVFDTNQNGKLDAADASWSEFRIWQDRNQDGVSQDSELTSLDRAGIRSIDLTPAGNVIHFADGSAITGTSAYSRTDGTTGIAGDVSLAFAPAERGGGAIDVSLGKLIQAMATYSGERSAETWSGPAAANDATLPGCVAAAWHS